MTDFNEIVKDMIRQIEEFNADGTTMSYERTDGYKVSISVEKIEVKECL